MKIVYLAQIQMDETYRKVTIFSHGPQLNIRNILFLTMLCVDCRRDKNM